MRGNYLKILTIIAILNIFLTTSSCNKNSCIPDERDVLTIKIGVYDITVSDPFDENYIYNSEIKMLHQQNQKMIEEKYNIKIEYISKKDVYGNYFSGIVDDYKLKRFIDDNDLDMMLVDYYEIKALNDNYDYLFPLSKDVVENQHEIFNKLTMYEQNVYGYACQNQISDKYLYYNIDMIEEYGLQDPLELWYQGRWNVSALLNFYNNNVFSKKLFSGDLNNFMIGFVHSLGGEYFDTKLKSFNSENNILMLLTTEKFKKLGYVSQSDSNRNEFINQNCLFTDQYISDVDFNIGIVPYPLSDDAVVEVITTEVEEEAKTLSNRRKIKTEEGLYIKGIDISASGYSIPLKECVSLAIINKENKKDVGLLTSIISELCEKNELNAEIITANIKNKFNFSVYCDLLYETNQYLAVEMFDNIDLSRPKFTPYKYLWPLMVLNECEDKTKEEVSLILMDCDKYFLEYYNKHIGD